MKKLLCVLILAAGLTACGNSGSETTTDSTSVSTDTNMGTSGTGGTGTSGGAMMNTDTTGMGTAR